MRHCPEGIAPCSGGAGGGHENDEVSCFHDGIAEEGEDNGLRSKVVERVTAVNKREGEGRDIGNSDEGGQYVECRWPECLANELCEESETCIGSSEHEGGRKIEWVLERLDRRAS